MNMKKLNPVEMTDKNTSTMFHYCRLLTSIIKLHISDIFKVKTETRVTQRKPIQKKLLSRHENKEESVTLNLAPAWMT